MAIPRTIHQLWVSHTPPARFVALRERWRRRNPHWGFRLWTPEDVMALAARRDPALAAAMADWPPARRLDIGRWLVLEAEGGVCAGLDCDCLRPIDPLLAGLALAAAETPEGALSAAFVASAPGHPVWAAVRGLALAGDAGPGGADGGRALLERVWAGGGGARLPARLAHPFTEAEQDGDGLFDIETWERRTREAFVAPYGRGAAWDEPPRPLDGLPRNLPARVNAADPSETAYPAPPAAPRITCVTAAAGWTPGLALAVDSYLRQTHPERELVIACPAAEAGLEAAVRGQGRDDIRLVVAVDAGDAAGLLAAGAAAGGGALACRWDAGELHDPRRLEIQLRVLREARAHACLIARRPRWRPAQRRMAIAAERLSAPGSLMIERGRWGDPFAGGARVCAIDLPRLTLGICGPDDTGFDAAWAATAARFEGERCDAVAAEMGKRLPLDLAGWAGVL